jgi:proton glutamate symport protein
VSLTTKVLIGLVAGFALGLFLAGSQVPQLHSLPGIIEPLGTVWINAIRMTVVPLVVSSIIAGILAVPDLKTLGTVGWRMLAVFFGIVISAATFAVIAAPLVMSAFSIDETASAAIRASAGVAANTDKIPGVMQWITELVPVNPVQAAATGAMLPLIVFSVAFGVAAATLQRPQRDSIAIGARAVSETMLAMVRWILMLAPFGVFALSVGLAARLGLSAAGAVIYYVIGVSALCTLWIGVLYVVAAVMSKYSLRQFVSAAAPPQAVAFSSRSSLASLPAMVEQSEQKLRSPITVTSFVLPLAASVFRTGSAIALPTGVLFIAKLYGVPIGPGGLATIALTSALLTFSVPGIPGGSILIMAPVLAAVGLPVEGIGILLGVDTIPDMFRTTTNVTGDMTAAAILSGGKDDNHQAS